MGKAIIFNGLYIDNPIQTVTFGEEDSDVSRITNYFSNLNQSYRAALKTLITDLKDANSFDKINYLMLPIIANNEGEALQNVLLSEKTIPSNDLVAKVTLSNNMLFTSTQLNLTTYLNNANSFATTNLAIGAIVNVTDYPKTEGVTSEQIGFLNNGIKLYRDAAAIGYNSGASSGTAGAGQKAFSYTTTKGCISAKSDFTNEEYYIIYGNSSTSTHTLEGFTKVVNNTPSFILSGTPFDPNSPSAKYWKQFTGGIKLLWVGHEMTNAELMDTHIAFNSFVETIESI